MTPSSRSEPVSGMDTFARIREILAQQRGWEGLDPRGPGLREATPQWEVDQLLMVAERNARGAVSAADVVAWLRSPEWDGDATWEHYARAIADDIERSVEKGRIPSTGNAGAV